MLGDLSCLGLYIFGSFGWGLVDYLVDLWVVYLSYLSFEENDGIKRNRKSSANFKKLVI